MALTKYIVKYDQNLFDVALQLYGDISGIGDILLKNPNINLGSSIKIGDSLIYEPLNSINPEIVNYFNRVGIVVSNGMGNVYHKSINEALKLMILIDKDRMEFTWSVSGEGVMYIDWGDNTKIEVVELSLIKKDISHNMDSVPSSSIDYRKIRFYGDFSISGVDVSSSNIFKIFAIDNFNVSQIDLSKNFNIENIGFLDIIQHLSEIDLHNIKINNLLPLISQTDLRDLWINDSTISTAALDSYFIGLVKNYSNRPECNVRMWGNNSPSGIYQRPDVLFDPQNGLEAMWVLENERGWSIQEIIEPPLPGTINRRFRTKLGQKIIDEIGGINCELHLPISEFRASTSSRLISNIIAETVRTLEFKVASIPGQAFTNGTMIGAKDNVRGSHLKINTLIDGSILFSSTSGTHTSIKKINDGLVHTVAIVDMGDLGIMCYLDGELLATLSVSASRISSKFSIGCLIDSGGAYSDYVNLSMWDFNIGGSAHFIPLPHLGYDSISGNKYILNNIKEGFYDPLLDISGKSHGSDYMQTFGAVARNKNELLTGFSEKIGNGTTEEYWSEVVMNQSLAGSSVEISASLKLNQLALSSGVKSHVSVFAVNSSGVVFGSKLGFIESIDTSYNLLSATVTIPVNAFGIKVIANHSPANILLGNAYAKEIRVSKIKSEYIPNRANGESLLPMLFGDKFINGSNFLNKTPFVLSFNGTGNELITDIWNKSRTDIWKPGARTSEYYNALKPKQWRMVELDQRFIVNNINTSFLYYIWVKVDGFLYKDLFQYVTQLSGDDKERCNRYIHLNT